MDRGRERRGRWRRREAGVREKENKKGEMKQDEPIERNKEKEKVKYWEENL